MPELKKQQAIFLLAHQDDECFAFQLITKELESEREVWCIFVTDGGVKCARRNMESRRVLLGMGVKDSRILFFGESVGIKDGQLLASLSMCASGLREILSMQQNVVAVYVPAWEGGHPDHDGLHFVAATILEKAGKLDRLFQFPLYNAYKPPRYLFKVMSPLRENGEILRVAIPFGRRWRHAFNCFQYPSQWISWFDLFPMAAFSYLANRQFYQRASMERLGQRPHQGALSYEVRGLANWNSVRRALICFAKDAGLDLLWID